MRITNLTNSPYDLIDAKGKKVRLGARDTVVMDVHPLHLNAYRTIGYFLIEDTDEQPKRQQRTKQGG